MKIGLVPLNVNVKSPEAMVSLCQKAEEVGLESLWTFEHVVVPVDYGSRYPYSPDGKMGVAPETHFVDPLIACTFAAAHTSKLRFGTGINILPQTNPLLAAKQVASLDFLSGGRFLFGVGAGWLQEEFDAMGTPFARRGARMDEYLVAMKKVWSGEVVEHEGEHLRWSGFKSYPLPAQRPHPPIIVGGDSDAALRRVCRHGDGWFAVGMGLEDFKAKRARLEATAAKEGRALESIELTTMWPFVMEGVEAIGRYAELGVERLVVPLQALGERNPLLGIDKLGEALAKLRA